MQKKDIKKIFSSHISVPFGTKPPSAVLVPLMEKENGSLSKISKIVGISRSTLWRKVNKNKE